VQSPLSGHDVSGDDDSSSAFSKISYSSIRPFNNTGPTETRDRAGKAAQAGVVRRLVFGSSGEDGRKIVWEWKWWRKKTEREMCELGQGDLGEERERE
jgi:hypothetical protein